MVLWDACAELSARDFPNACSIDRDGAAWALDLDGIEWEEPEDADVAGRELKYLDAERRRLVYVAATRARDLLVLPVAGAPRPDWITGRLVSGGAGGADADARPLRHRHGARLGEGAASAGSAAARRRFGARGRGRRRLACGGRGRGAGRAAQRASRYTVTWPPAVP